MKAKYLTFVLLFLLSFGLDQGSKIWAREHLRPQGYPNAYPTAKVVVKGYFDLRYSENPGSAFGFFRNMNGAKHLLFGVGVLCLAIIGMWLAKAPGAAPWLGAKLGLLAGGWGGYALAALAIAAMYLGLVFCIAEMAAALPHTGGAYSFARASMGPWGGFITGLCENVEYVLTPAVVVSFLATYLAARVPARMLVLETPFDNIRGLMASHLRREVLPFEPAFRFPNDRHLDMADLPVLIFHGTRDRVVPFASAAKLKQFLNPGDEFVTIEGGAHNNLGKFPLYRERLANWLMSRG